MAISATDVQKAYLAYFGRPADAVGLAYWQGSTAAVMNAGFAASAEYATMYSGMTVEQRVSQVYWNLLGRAPDVPGLLYWAGEMTAGRQTVSSLVTSMQANALGVDITTIANRVTYATAFTAALDTVDEIVGYSGTAAANAARAAVRPILDTAATLTTAQAALTASLVDVIAAGTAVPAQTFTLTTGADTWLGGTGNDTFNAGTSNSLSAFDNIDGAGGTDTLTALLTDIVMPGGITIKNIEALNFNVSGAGFTIDTSTYTGATSLTLSDSAQVAGAISVNGTGAVTVSSVGATSNAATITIGATTAPTGAVVVSQTSAIGAGAAGGIITDTGGTTVSIASTTTNSGAVNNDATAGAVVVTGTANTTSVTVAESAKVTKAASAGGTTESAAVTFNAHAMAAGDTMTFAGLTFTSTGATTQAQAGAAFASLADGATTGGGTGQGTYSGALTGWTTGAYVAGSTSVAFTSSTANTNVTDLTTYVTDATGAGVVAAGIVETDGVAVTAGLAGVLAGAVTITDVNAASATAAGVITSVSLTNFAAATANSGALATVTLAGTGTSYAQTNGALTTPTFTTETLNLKGITTSGAVTLDTDVTTISIASSTGTNKLASLVDASATTVNISGDKGLTLTAHTFAATANITSTSTGAVTISDALAVGQKYTGGSGVDTIKLTVGGTAAITTGAGADVVTYAGALVGGTVDAGDGTDTIVMTAAQAVTATTDTTFASTVSNFEVLKLSAATGAAAAINMANADGMNSLTIAGATVGALTVTNAGANFTLTQNALTSFASSIALATDTGATDNVNLVFSALNGFTNSAAFTIGNVETLTITTSATSTPTQVFVAPITATSAKTVTVAGNDGINLTGLTATTLTSLDASGITGTGPINGLTWTAGALAASSVIKGSATGDNYVTLSAANTASTFVTYTGGSGVDKIVCSNGLNNVINLGDGTNTFTSTGAGGNTITGGTGIDTISVGTGANTIHLGGGTTANTVTISAAAAGLNMIDTTSTGVDTLVVSVAPSAGGYYPTLTGWAVGDKIDFTAVDNNGGGADTHRADSALGAKVTLGPASSFANYLDACTNTDVTGAATTIKWFQFTDGNTYIVVDNSAALTFQDGGDTVICLTGAVNLATSTTASDVLTLV